MHSNRSCGFMDTCPACFPDHLSRTRAAQYHLHCQLLKASQHAAAQRVVLKGDLPIGVDKRSVDTWMHPQLFRMDKSTGEAARRGGG